MDIAAVGELLIDFTPEGKANSYTANPGGAPANLLAQMRKLGKSAAFMGMVGDDHFGHFLCDTLRGLDIDTTALCLSSVWPTTLAFVHIDSTGERSFSFYRNPGADQMFKSEDIRREIIESCRYFHFGGVSLSKEPMRTATLEAVRYARQLKKTVTFDPNYRPMLWENEEEAVRFQKEGIGICDVLKVSDEEALLLSGEADLAAAAVRLHAMGPRLVFVTCGAKGCLVLFKNEILYSPAYDRPRVDTTGAGDSFFGAVLAKLMDDVEALEHLDAEKVKEIAAYGNAAGSITISAYGAMPALPSHAEIMDCINCNQPIIQP